MKLDKKLGLGQLHCKVCGQHFQTGINCKRDAKSRHRDGDADLRDVDLSAAVDVYSDWIDACEAVAKEDADELAEDRRFSNYGTSREAAMAGGDDDDDEDY